MWGGLCQHPARGCSCRGSCEQVEWVGEPCYWKDPTLGVHFPLTSPWSYREGNRIRLLVLFVWALSVAGCADQCGQTYARILAHLCLCARLLSPTSGWACGWGAAALPLLLPLSFSPPPAPPFPSQWEIKTYSAQHGSHICSQLACKVNYS